MPQTHRLTRVAGVALAFATGLGATACSGRDDGGSASPSALPTPSVPYAVKLVTLTGKLPKSARDEVRKEAGAAIEAWWEAAYLSTGAADRFPGFTPGAAKLAERDADLMTNRADGKGIDSRLADRKEVDLDVLAVKGRAKGATAVLHLAYSTGGLAEKCTVGGTVSLVPVGHHWRIFGYDVTHHCAPKGKS